VGSQSKTTPDPRPITTVEPAVDQDPAGDEQ